MLVTGQSCVSVISLVLMMLALSLPFSTAISELPFLDLGDDSRVSGDGKFFGDDDNIRPLNEAELPSFPVPFGNGTETSIYISSNGLISFGDSFTAYTPLAFPISQKVVAPYWDDIDLTQKGLVLYAALIQGQTSRLNNRLAIFDLVNRYITDTVLKGMSVFRARWILAVRWINVCPFGNSSCTLFNTFQAVLATDGARSYAIYTYECGKLNWVKHSAAIGFSASDNFFAEHPLSRTSSVNEIACINIPSSNWANIAYEIDNNGQPAEFMGVSNSSTSITFTWKPPRNISGIITNYTFQCSTPGDGETHNLNFVINSSQTTTTLSGFLPYTNYSCSIIARTSAGGGPPAFTSVTTLQDVPSGTPQDFIITATSRTLTLSWSPPLPSQRNGVIISYLINCSSKGSIINSTRTSSTSLTITGLQPFTNYTCTMSAATIVGDGPPAMQATTTSEDKPEAPPRNVVVTSITSISAVLSWSPPVKPNGVITQYQIRCSNSEPNEIGYNVSGSQTTTTLSGLLPYTNYSCSITAHTSAGGGPAAIVNVTTKQDIPNGPPQDIDVTVTSHTLTLSWSPPLPSQHNGVIISYLINCSSGGSIINSTRTNSTSLTIAGLQPFTNYTCTVSAATMVGDGPATMRDAITSEDRPDTHPTMFSSSANSTTITFTWGPPDHDKLNGLLVEYRIRCSDGRQVHIKNVTGSQTTTTLSGLLPYISFSCNITAHTSVGGGPAATTSVTTEQDVPSGPPLNLTISVTPRTMLLFWSPPHAADRNGIITNYTVTCSLVNDIIQRTTTRETRLTVTGLEPFTNYTCSVSAATVVGSGPALVKSVVTGKVPPKVIAAQANIVQVINSNVVIQFSIMDAAPPVQIEGIHWNFTTSSGMTRPVTNTTTISFSFDRLTLTINNAQPSHIGSYMITVSNPAGSSTGSVQLSILVPAQLLYANGSEVKRNLTNTVTFNCTADGIPQPQISWRRNGQFLNVNQLRRYSVVTSPADDGFRSKLPGVKQTESKLTISNLREIDQGTFSCIAQSATTSPAALLVPFRLTIEMPLPPNYCEDTPCQNEGRCENLSDRFLCHCTASFTGPTCNIAVRTEFKPVITTQPMNINGDLFSTVSLTCIADEGYPEPEIFWYKDGTKLKTPSTSNSLVFEELRPSNRGFYYCEAVNVAGTATSDTVQVNIQGVVQYEAFIRQNETELIDSEILLQQINNALAGSKLALNASFFFIEPLMSESATMRDVPILITLITDDGAGSEMLRQEVLVEMERVRAQIGLQIRIDITTVDRFDGCQSNITLIRSVSGDDNLTITIVWPETNLAEVAEVTCPCGTLNITAQVATRRCGGNFINGAKWDTANIDPCNLTDSARRICQLSELRTEERLDRLEVFTNSSNQIMSDEVSASVTILVASTDDVEGNRTLSENFLNIVDNIVRAEPMVLQESQTEANSSAKLLDAIERVSENIPIPENETSALITQSTFAVSVQKVDAMTFTGLSISAVIESFDNPNIDEPMVNMINSARSTGSLSLPSNLLQKANGSRVTLSVFATNSLFLRRDTNNTEIASIIIAAGVVGVQRVENLDPPIVAVFQRNPNVNGSDPVCSFWDQALDDGYGGWSSEGCFISSSTSSNDTEITCMCNHLTNFAILLDVSPQFANRTVSDRPEDFFLDAVSYIGVILSIASLLLTIISYIGTRKLRLSDHGQLLLNLCVALLGLYISFIFSIHSSGVPPLCAIVSIALHYFMLVVFMVMAAEAVNLYMKLVVVLGHSISHYIIKVTVICWVVPAFVVLFCFAPSPSSYMHPNVCRAFDVPFYIGLIVPFVVIYLFNWTVYIIILATLCCKNYQKDAEDKKNRVKTKQQLIAAATLSVLFGLGWGIGLLATEGVKVSALRDFFSAIFIICTAFQGVMVFCLQTLRSTQVRRTWARWFHMATGRDISGLTSSANVSQIWRNRRSHKHSSSAGQRDSYTLKSNDYEITTLQRNVKNVSFPAGLIVTTIDKHVEPDKKESFTAGGGNDYVTVPFDSPEKKTTNFDKELTNSDREVETTLTPKGDELMNVESGTT